jgi:hypothetical protein|tara:strand:- start:166 stop:708 length:543 start_codon:yes stop_codon:yes gene_type:complete
MNIKSLTLKNTLSIEETGELYYDLTAPSFSYKRELGVKGIHYVTMDQAGRIDKIAELYFGGSQYVDAICIVNNIFNPFTVSEGDVLVIPNLDNPNLVYRRPNPATRPSVQLAQYTNTDRQSEKDQSRIQRLTQKAKTKKTGVKAPIPPNMLQQGQDAKIYGGGKILLGANLPTRNRNTTN